MFDKWFSGMRRWLALATTLVAIGCGGPSRVGVNASGVVTLDDVPLTRGDIVATGTGGVVRQASVDAQGAFTLLDVPPGSYVLSVRVEGYAETDYDVGDRGRKTLKPGVKPIQIPERYRDPLTAGLTADIADGVPIRIQLTTR